MNANTFVYGVYSILSTRLLRLYKPYTLLTYSVSKLPEHVVTRRHIHNKLSVYSCKLDVRRQLLFRTIYQDHNRWFQTTSSNKYRRRRRSIMDPEAQNTTGSDSTKHKKNSHSGAMAGHRRMVVHNTTESEVKGQGHAANCQDTGVEHKDELAVFIGNLRMDIESAKMKENIVAVFTGAGIHINPHQVVLVRKAFAMHAFIYLTSVDEKAWILKGFGSQLDLSSVVIPGKKLKIRSKSIGAINYRRPEHSSIQMSSLSERSSIESSAPLIDAALQTATAMRAIDESNALSEDDSFSVHPQKVAVVTRTSPIPRQRKQSHWQVEPNPVTQYPLQTTRTRGVGSNAGIPSNNNHSTAMQTQTVKSACTMSKTLLKSYAIGQNLGNESRHMEFKAGQGSYLQKQLKDHVAKYTCAFLNSEGGTLLVGVNDSGEVLGIQCTQRIEDLLRQKIDATIKEISPQVFPNVYTIDFVPVCDISGMPLENRKILDITVKQIKTSSLYQTHQGHVFIRRDGSVQGPLKASDIQEWTRMMMRKELEEREEALHAIQQKDRFLEREMDKQRKLTMVLTRELKSQRSLARQFKAQLRRVDQKQLRRKEAGLAGSDSSTSSASKEDMQNVRRDTRQTSVLPTGTAADSVPTQHKSRTRSLSIISRISAVIKPHKSIPVKSTPIDSQKLIHFRDAPLDSRKPIPIANIPSDPNKTTLNGSHPSIVHKATPECNSLAGTYETTPSEKNPDASTVQNTLSESSNALSENKVIFSVGHDGVRIPVGTAVIPRKCPTAPRFSRGQTEPHSTKSRSCVII